MRICITGATGFIGRALVPVLIREGHTVAAWVRSSDRAKSQLGADVEIVDAAGGLDALTELVERSDAVVNLAGAPIMGGRWTEARRKVLRDSRIDSTRMLVAAITKAARRPSVFVSGSAVGYYGDRADEVLDEQSAAGNDFLAGLCLEWEAAAREAEPLGVRVVLMRTSVVLGRDGGALQQMLPPFRFGVGGPIGSGRQYMPWIHLHDYVRIVATALVDERYSGPLNAAVPQQVTSREFARALGHALKRPAFLPTPALALRLIFGEAAIVLLASQRIRPAALERLGFTYSFPNVDAALANILGGATVTITPLGTSPGGSGDEASGRYLDKRRPTYELRTTTIVNAPLDKTFAFFSQAQNLGLITPASMGFSIRGQAPVIAEGVTIGYLVRVAFVTIPWTSRIVRWKPGQSFVDLQEQGPYKSWWHEHVFRAVGTQTIMEDRVWYAPPFGVLGRLANRFFIAPTLRRVFQHRGDVIQLRFGVSQ